MRLAMTFAVAAVLLFHASLVWSGKIVPGSLADMDAYARLLRLRELWYGGRWYDPILDALGHPHGIEFHWGRAMDLMVLPVLAAGAAVAGPEQSLFAVALLFAPVLHALTAVMLVWGGRRVLPPRSWWLLPLLFLAQRNVTHYFDLGYFDHHALLALAAASVTGLALEHFATGRGEPLAFSALVCAFTAWATPEGLILAGPLVLTLAGLWVVRGDAAHLRALRTFALWLAGALAAALAAERPPGGWLVAEVDRLSIIHVAAVTIMALLTVLAALRPARRPRWRGVVAAGSTVGGAALLALLFPQLVAGGYLGGSYGAVSPEVSAYLLDNVPDDKPFLPVNAGTAYNFLLDLGHAFPALAWALLAVRREASPRHLFALVQLLFFLPLALAVARMTLYVEMALLLPLAECLVALAGLLRGPRRRRAAAAIVAAAFGPALAAVAIRAVFLPGAPVGDYACNYTELARLMAARGLSTDRTRTILTPLFAGPEVAYKTGLPTVSGPFHRDERGVRDNLILYYAAPDDALVVQTARQRRLGHVVLCRAQLPNPSRLPDTMLRRLALRQPPAWLQPVPLPPELADRFLLYAVRLGSH